LACIEAEVATIIANRDNRLPFRVSETGSLATIVPLARFRPATGTALDMTTANGFDTSDAVNRNFAMNLTAAQIADWPESTSVNVYITLFNADNTPFSKFTLEAIVKP